MTEKKFRHLSPSNTNQYELSYDNKRLAGFKAMQSRPVPGVYRVPDGSWSGYGISHTSPAGFGLDAKSNDDIWKSPDTNPTALNTSNVLEHSPMSLIRRVTGCNWSDLPALLSSLGLDRYVPMFVQHEVDLDTFATFTDQDLMTIGVSAFGSRKKMLLAISGELELLNVDSFVHEQI